MVQVFRIQHRRTGQELWLRMNADKNSCYRRSSAFIGGPNRFFPSFSPVIQFVSAPLPVTGVDQTRLERLSQSRPGQPPPDGRHHQPCQELPHQLNHAALSGLLHNPSVARYPLNPAPDTTPASFAGPLRTRTAERGPGRARQPWYRPANRARRPRAQRRRRPEY